MTALIALGGLGIFVCLGFWALWKVQLPPHRRAYTVSQRSRIPLLHRSRRSEE